MKKLLSIFMLMSLLNVSMMAAIVDCGCAYSGTPSVDVEIEYHGDGDCCHPVGPATWAHLDSVTYDIIDSGHLNSGDAAAACEDILGSPGC